MRTIDPVSDWLALDGVGGKDKRMSLGDAVRTLVHPRDMIHIAYADARPNAAMLEVVRQFAGTDPRFTLVTAGLVNTQHALVASGIVERVVASFAGENFPAARPNPAFQRAVRDGQVTIEQWSLWSLVARLMAGALGLPFQPTRSLEGSTMASEQEGVRYARVEDPFSPGSSTGVVAPLRPDVVLLQGVAADTAGNVISSAPYGEGLWGALAARRGVIACVERIVDTETIRASNSLVRIPAHCVQAVCEVPFGSHPYGLYDPTGTSDLPGYVEDVEFMRDVLVASKTEETFAAWIDEWVHGTADHDEYLGKLGADRLRALTAAADPDVWRDELAKFPPSNETANRSEAMVVTAARRIDHRVRAADHDAILAGVGQSNLASWMAARKLKHAGIDVELMAEIGLFGYIPRPGDPFIFAKRNLPTATMLTDTMTVLGAFINSPATRSLGVIGAGQIDAEGNTNSTFTENGEYLLGSGGANDIASGADEVLVVVAHDRSRLVSRVPYVTCPGKNVRTIVTSAGVFERVDNRLRLTAYLPGPSDAQEAVDQIRAGCDWDFEVADDLVAEPAPDADELRLLRSFDPEKAFLRGGTRGGQVNTGGEVSTRRGEET